MAIGEVAKTIGDQAARRLFAAGGDHSEIHLSEKALSLAMSVCAQAAWEMCAQAAWDACMSEAQKAREQTEREIEDES